MYVRHIVSAHWTGYRCLYCERNQGIYGLVLFIDFEPSDYISSLGTAYNHYSSTSFRHLVARLILVSYMV